MVDFEKIKIYFDHLKDDLFKPLDIKLISPSDFRGVTEYAQEIKNLQFKNLPKTVETFNVSANKNDELRSRLNLHWVEFFNSSWYKNNNNS